MAKLRLLIVVDEMEVGGTQRQIVQLLQHLDRSKYHVELLYFRNTSFLVDELREYGIPVTLLEKHGRIDVGFIFRLVGFLKQGKFDLIHALSLSAEFWAALANSLSIGVPFISSIRARCEWYSSVHWLLKRWVVYRSTRVVSNSRAGAEYVADRLGRKPEEFEIVYNGISLNMANDEKSRIDLRKQLGVVQGQGLGLFVGRLVEDKNIPSLIRTAAVLKERGINLKIVLVGEGHLRSLLEHQIDVANLGERVQLLGERRDVPEIMLASDFLVLPSLEEGLSNVILEAMALGCPVIASDVGGNSELIANRQSGLLYLSDNHVQLADAIEEIVRSPELADSLRAQAMKQVQERFSISAMVSSMDLIYQAAVSPGSVAP